MRTPRSLLLQPHVAFHKMWQAHDGQHLLRDPVTKRDYLDQLFRFKPRASKAGVRFFAFCLMDNHVHECGAIAEDFKPFSEWMRVAHGTFGQRFNKRNGRRGKVAIERPKTVVLEDDAAILQVMLYLDANPVAAGLVDDAAEWEWSSHRFFAYGEANAWTRNLDIPEAYLSLGDTNKERQEQYREMYEAYVASRLGDRGAQAENTSPERMSEGESGTEASKTKRNDGIACGTRWLPGNAGEGDFFGRVEWVSERQSALRAWRRRRMEQRPDEVPSGARLRSAA
jgi:putative transposase